MRVCSPPRYTCHIEAQQAATVIYLVKCDSLDVADGLLSPSSITDMPISTVIDVTGATVHHQCSPMDWYNHTPQTSLNISCESACFALARSESAGDGVTLHMRVQARRSLEDNASHLTKISHFISNGRRRSRLLERGNLGTRWC